MHAPAARGAGGGLLRPAHRAGRRSGVAAQVCGESFQAVPRTQV
ncbi:MAG: hypothetical protein ACLRWQ_18945 [Flavonifractor plautii]